MAGPAFIFKELHRLRRLASNMQNSIDNAPRQMRAQQNVVAKREEEQKNAQEHLKKLKVGIHEREVSVKSTQAQIKRYEQQLNDVSHKKELDALQAEITQAKAKIATLEEEALQALEEVDARTAELPAYEAAVKTARAEFAVFERDYQERLNGWIKERDNALALIAVEEAKLPADIRQRHDRVVKSLGADAYGEVEGRICKACHTEITAQLAHNLQMQNFVQCSCGRVLYVK